MKRILKPLTIEYLKTLTKVKAANNRFNSVFSPFFSFIQNYSVCSNKKYNLNHRSRHVDRSGCEWRQDNASALRRGEAAKDFLLERLVYIYHGNLPRHGN